MYNNYYNIDYLKNLNFTYYKINNKIYKHIRKFNTPKKKYKNKYKLNLLNKFYSYTSTYISKYIYRELYKLKYLKSFIIFKNNQLYTIILDYKKIFIKKKQKKNIKYNIIIGSGKYKSWIGIGISKNTSYKKAYITAVIKSKKNIYNLNFKSNDYKIFKYKNYKFSLINKTPNIHNLNIYNNIIFLTGLKKLKLISYTNSSTKNILNSLLYNFN
uniref:Ribosomal protein S5 n=1 Tax=Babesia gibsoni TaxID=33632 RepID=A0A6M8NL08_BABGI|nr:ribosomal protein S5 [Babesia gibsoni]